MEAANDALEVWKRLMRPEHAALVDAASECDGGSVREVDRLRGRWPADLVRCALELAAARRKAIGKFPDRPPPADLVCDVPGVEQATSAVVADHKAERFKEAGMEDVADLCCGIGGDAMSLVNVANVVGVDVNPVRAWMAGRNAGCETTAADVTQIALKGRAFHFDPARREEASGAGARSRRSWRLEDYRPGPEFIARLLADCPDGAIKLGPGVEFSALPTPPAPPVPPPSEIELISENGRLVQAVMWRGKLAFNAGLRTATLLPQGVHFIASPDRPARTAEGIGRFLLEPNAAIERAGLLGALCDELDLAEMHPGLGILTADHGPASPWLTAFEVIEDLPWRLGKVREALRSLGGGQVEVKTRGKAVDPDVVQKQLTPGNRGEGERRLTVFVLRLGRNVRAVIAEREGPKA